MGIRTKLWSYGKVFEAGKQEKRRGEDQENFPPKGNRVRGKNSCEIGFFWIW
jgi:hypothetical protein